MQAQKIILLQPTHEQSAPSFHVEGSLAKPFLKFLEDKGLTAWEPPHEVPIEGPDHRQVVEISVEADTDIDHLEGLMEEFLASPAAADK